MITERQLRITTVEELESLYPAPSARAVAKQIDRIDGHCAAFIAASPLVMLATCGDEGADCSPRGGAPGFVRVADEKTLLLPDHRGNNRLDSLRNILANPAVGLLFLVPGVTETLRVNGAASLVRGEDLRDRLGPSGPPPTSVLVIDVWEAFIQCSRALVRAGAWDPARHVERSTLPSLGTILAAHTRGVVNADAYDRDLEARLRAETDPGGRG